VRRVLSFAGLAVLMAAAACTDSPVEVSVRQPIDFPHETHLTYFSSGLHRAERIRMHLEIFGTDEIPDELAEGRCVACHDDLPERTACAGCHVPFQNPALRTQTEARRCVACHRGAWSRAEASIPGVTACLECHRPEVSEVHLVRAAYTGASVALARAGAPRVDEAATEVPWVRLTTMPPNVYFSHTAHVRFAGLPCVRCHEDVSGLMSPPTRVRVLSMSDCLKCHVESNARTDCLACHK
jgi:hypothetical protein